MSNTTKLYDQMIAAEKAWNEDQCNLTLMYASDALYQKYWAEVSKLREEWEAIRQSDSRASAEENAYDTEGTHDDRLRWYEVAFSTYEEAKNSGYSF